MDAFWKDALWQQFGASIDMLENDLLACPDALWTNTSEYQDFWYIVYHTLFWVDLYLSGSEEGFMPPAPFTLIEMDPAGLIPETPYTKDELQTYLRYCRQKCQTTIESLTEERARELGRFGKRQQTFFELQIYNLRHVEYHVGELNLILGQNTGSAPDWVGRAKP